MVPEAVCASCRGTFVEKMEDSNDDPREFHRGDGGDDLPPGMDPLFMLLQGLMSNRGGPGEAQAQARRSRSPSSPSSPHSGGTGPAFGMDSPPASGFSFQIRTSGGGGDTGTRTFTFGGPRGGPGRGGGRIPTMNEGPDDDIDGLGGPAAGPGGINGMLMAQYLMAMLGNRGGAGGPGMPLHDLLGGGPESGRMGDYVFNQEALDQIITQLMEQSNASRPVPATDEIMKDLPRELLLEGSPMLEKDCAVCKDQFKVGTEDPDEQIVVTLPCHHPFHEPCIMPWLKSSGTCPVCRHQLVPQPNSHGPGSPPNDGNGRGHDHPSGSPPSPRSPGREGSGSSGGGSGGGGGFLQNLFGSMMGGGNNSSNTGNGPNSGNGSSRYSSIHRHSHSPSHSPSRSHMRTPSDPPPPLEPIPSSPSMTYNPWRRNSGDSLTGRRSMGNSSSGLGSPRQGSRPNNPNLRNNGGGHLPGSWDELD